MAPQERVDIIGVFDSSVKPETVVTKSTLDQRVESAASRQELAIQSVEGARKTDGERQRKE